jgi:hypothetical protein
VGVGAQAGPAVRVQGDIAVDDEQGKVIDAREDRADGR